MLDNILRKLLLGLTACGTLLGFVISQSVSAQESPLRFTEPVHPFRSIAESQSESRDEEQIRRIVQEVLDSREAGHENQGSSQAAQYQLLQSMNASTYADPLSDNLSVTLGKGGRLKIYGYGRGDLIYSTSQFNNTVIPFFSTFL